jgi:hexosaminidase
VKSVKTFVVRCALMGINMVMLYTEDTYEVSGEPFFGYLRGAYTESELKEIDDYAFSFGIEVVPCIQTLGHLEQMLHWPVYSHLRDTEDVILAESEGTYEFLTKIIKAASAPFRTSRIHLGMDEAEGLGTGRYRRRMGPKPAFDIFNAHVGRVMAICQDLKLKPMIWSDMYFRIGSETGDYYDRNSTIPEHVIDEIPKGVDLVYWDYYHTDSEFYSDMIDKHMHLLDGSTTVVAGAAWTWSRFWTYYPFSFTTTDAMMRAARAKGVKEVILTLWGDDGAECDYFSAFPAMQYFAEHAYAEDFDRTYLRQNFMGSCAGYDVDSLLQVSRVDEVPFVQDPSASCANISKWLIWEDILLGHLHPQFDEVESKELRIHYATLSNDLQLLLEAERETDKSYFLHGILDFPFHVAKVLSLKVNLRNTIVHAYVNNEREALKSIVDNDVVELMKEIDLLWKSHRHVWLSRYKPFGLELLEARYGALRCRVESLRDRLNDYLERVIDSIPELEVQPLKVCPHHALVALPNLYFYMNVDVCISIGVDIGCAHA